jgi:hypothetical protein
MILSGAPWPMGTVLEIKNQRTELSIRARVVWCGPQDSSGSYKLGVEFEEPVPNFWGDDYDPDDPSSAFV